MRILLLLYIYINIIIYIYINCSDANAGVIGKQQRVQNPNLAEKRNIYINQFH